VKSAKTYFGFDSKLTVAADQISNASFGVRNFPAVGALYPDVAER
jgi:hypothetical protein